MTRAAIQTRYVQNAIQTLTMLLLLTYLQIILK